MVIISQDSRMIYNFNNVSSIDIVDNEIYITDNILKNKGCLIGKYENEERAMELLDCIIIAIDNNDSIFELPEI